MKSLKKNSYISITSDMVTNLKLSGINLIVYALIHGYSKDGEDQKFTGSIDLICTWTNSSRSSIIATLKYLVINKFIFKKETMINGIKFCEYRHNDEMLTGGIDSAPGVLKYKKKVVRNQDGGSMESAPNIIDNIIINDNIDLKDNTNVLSKSKISSEEKLKIVEQEFYDSLKPHVKEFGKEMLRDFYDYWTESNNSKTKLRFQMQKTWDLHKRLVRWNSNNFSQRKPPSPTLIKSRVETNIQAAMDALELLRD